jgi:hypothetical protein
MVRAAFILLFVAAPAAAERPTTATQRLMLDLADAPGKLVDLVDPKVGLVFIDHMPEPEPTGKPRELHVCDVAKLGVFKTEIAPAIKAARKNGSLTCSNSGGSTCRAGGQGEWDPVLHFQFVKDDGGQLFLHAIAIDDEVLVGDDTIRAEHAAQAKLIAKLATACP